MLVKNNKSQKLVGQPRSLYENQQKRGKIFKNKLKNAYNS